MNSSESTGVVLKVSYIRNISDKTTAVSLHETWLDISPDFQRDYEKRSKTWTGSLIESIFLNRMMPPIWTVYNKKENCDEVLDGQHRLRTILDFVNNKFRIHYEKFPPIHNKEFKDLDKNHQQKVLNYTISFNKLPSSYRDSPSELFRMYEILNKASKPLNKYEVYKPLRLEFYKIISNKIRKFFATPLFQETPDDNKRGAAESRIIQIMSIYDIDFEQPLKWSSMEDIKERWCSKFMGDNDEEIRQKFNENRMMIEDLMELLYHSMDYFKQLNLFHEEGKCIVDKHNSLIFQVVLARSVKIFGKNRRPFQNVVEFVKHDILPNISKYVGREGRDGQFQKKMMSKINIHLRSIMDTLSFCDSTRLFKKEDKRKKLEEQNNICPLCDKMIEEHHDYHGDHIVPYAQGGLTLYSNLRVVHRLCHQALSLSSGGASTKTNCSTALSNPPRVILT
jgi:hypothetical protein